MVGPEWHPAFAEVDRFAPVLPSDQPQAKLRLNEFKYPADCARGNSKKYDELGATIEQQDAKGSVVKNAMNLLVRKVPLVAAALLALAATTADANGLTVKEEALVWSAKNWWLILARATDAEAIEYGSLYAETAAYLSQTSPSSCMQMISPSVFGPLGREQWPGRFLARQMAIQKRMVLTANTRPNAVPTEAQAGPILDRVLATLTTRHGAEAVKVLARLDKDTPAQHACLMHSRLYEEAARLPTHEGGVLIRWLNVP